MEENKYGTRLVNKKTGESKFVSVKNPEIIDRENCFVASKAKDEAIRAKFQWTPMSESWKNNCTKFWWYGNNLKKKNNPKMYSLREKLLSFGGESVCLPAYEEDIDNILLHGQFWFGSNAKKIKGEPCRCHSNSCKYYLNAKKEDVRICTGYALSEDGMWRQHTWVIAHKARSNQIIETTEPRIGYFGFVLTTEQCKGFCVANS